MADNKQDTKKQGTIPITVYAEPELHAKITKMSEDEFRSVSKTALMLILKGLDQDA